MKIKNIFAICLGALLLFNTCYAYQNINVNTMYDSFIGVFEYNSKKINTYDTMPSIPTFMLKKNLYEDNVIRRYPNTLQATHCYAAYIEPSVTSRGEVVPGQNELWFLCNEKNDVRQVMFHIMYFSDSESYNDGYVVKYRKNLKPYMYAHQIIQIMLICFGENVHQISGQAQGICEKAYMSNDIDTIDTITTSNGDCYTCVIHKVSYSATANFLSVSVSMPANM